MSNLTPRFIEWQGPEGFTVRLDEDGVMLRAPNGGLEEPGLNRLLDIIAEAKRVRDAQSSPTPQPPTRDQLRYDPEAYHVRRARRVVDEALDKLIQPDPDVIQF